MSGLFLPLLTLAEGGRLLYVVYGLVILGFLIVGILLSRMTRYEFEYVVVADYLRRKREQARRDSSWIRLVDPLIRFVAQLVRRMGLDNHRARIQRLLVNAGSPWGFTADEFIGFCVANALGAWVAFVLLMFMGGQGFKPFIPLVPAAAGYFLTVVTLKNKAQARRVKMDRQMPFVLDIISLTMGAGATFLQAVETITTVSDKGAMEEELEILLLEIKAGTPLREAIKNMTKRSDSEELALMVAAVSQAEQLGTPLVDIFRGQAETNRFRRTKAAEKAAAKIPNKMAVPTVFLMLAVLLLLFGPIIIKATTGGGLMG
jgi:tight adherence protein C